MRVSRMIAEPADPASTPPPDKEVRVEAAGGVVHLRYLPVLAADRDLPIFDLLTRYVTGWDATNDLGEPEPLNADRIHQLTPSVKDAFREAILTRPKAKVADRPEKAPEKPIEPVAPGSFVVAGDKPSESKEKP
jgi:hypothetical protein